MHYISSRKQETKSTELPTTLKMRIVQSLWNKTATPNVSISPLMTAPSTAGNIFCGVFSDLAHCLLMSRNLLRCLTAPAWHCAQVSLQRGRGKWCVPGACSNLQPRLGQHRHSGSKTANHTNDHSLLHSEDTARKDCRKVEKTAGSK